MSAGERTRPEPGQAHGLPRRLLVLLGALSAFGPLSMDLYLPALPQLTEDFGTTETLAQLTMSGCMIGLALGQLLVGPISDRYGRKRPLLLGVGTFALTSFLCTLAPDIGVLVALRLIQGVAGGAGIVCARAVVRDLCRTDAAARVFSMLVLVTSVAPVVAPVVGGQILLVTEWRGAFLALGLIGCVLLVAGAWGLPESLSMQQRSAAGLRAMGRNLVAVARERGFFCFTVVLACGATLLFSYISMSPFVLQSGHGLSAQTFALVFALNALGMVIGSPICMYFMRRHGPHRTLAIGLAIGAVGALAFTGAALARADLPILLPLLFLTVSSISLVMPTSTALALDSHAARAGTASGLLGLAQFGIGAAIAPLVSSIGTTDVVLGSTMATSALAGLAVLSALRRSRPRQVPGSVYRADIDCRAHDLALTLGE